MTKNIFPKEFIKNFSNRHSTKQESLRIKYELANLGSSVNQYLSELYRKESGHNPIPAEKIPSEFSNNDEEKTTYKKMEYKFSEFAITVNETAHFDILKTDFWNFRTGSINVNITSDNGSVPKTLLDGIEFIIDPRKAASSYNRRI